MTEQGYLWEMNQKPKFLLSMNGKTTNTITAMNLLKEGTELITEFIV